MNIITAKEAKEKTESYISPSIKSTIECVMKEIEYSCKYGDTSAHFYNFPFPNVYFENMKSTEFIKFMEKLGYEYNHIEKSKFDKDSFDEHTEEIIISW